MSKINALQKTIERMQIWKVNLKSNNKEITYGIHPVVIIDNWKWIAKINKGKVSNLLVVPITSKRYGKNIKSHIEIKNFKQYGLSKKSWIMCEQIRRVNIDDIITEDDKPLCNILETNEELANRITDCISTQTQSDNNYPKWKKYNFNILADDIYETEDYLKLYHKFKVCYTKEKYGEALSLCNKLINEISYFNRNRNKYYHKIYYNMSLCYLKMNDVNEAKFYASKSMTYLDSNNITEEYAHSMFVIIRCSGEDREFCYKAYKKLYKYYKMKNDLDNKSLCLFNMCNLKEQFNRCKVIYEKVSSKISEDKVMSMARVLGEN